jgi:hypothetical protein
MPLQNRVAPDGTLHAVAERGTMLGNRGGKFHRDDKTLGARRWATHHWICCDLHYKGMHHEAMGQGYTSLFFLDEVTALAAGHRPCFFCRRADAKAFLGDEKVEAFDRRVHAERVPSQGTSPTVAAQRSPLSRGEGTEEVSECDGVMVESNGVFYAKRGDVWLRWSFGGYTEAVKIETEMRILTPPSIIAILERGYRPRWHESALKLL